MSRLGILLLLLGLGSCGGTQSVPPLHTHASGLLGPIAYARIGSGSGSECPNQHLVPGWTLVVSGPQACAPSAQVQRVFRGYLQTPACLGRPGPNGVSCLTRGGYRCATSSWQHVPGVKTVVGCFTFTGNGPPKAGSAPGDFTAFSPRARN